MKGYFGALHLNYPNDNMMTINITPRCGLSLKVQSTEILIGTFEGFKYRGAAHRNINARNLIQ